MKRSVSQCSSLWANQASAWPRATRVERVIHVGQDSSFRLTHIFLADVSAVAYTESSGSHRGEPAESSNACLNSGSDKIRAVII